MITHHRYVRRAAVLGLTTAIALGAQVANGEENEAPIVTVPAATATGGGAAPAPVRSAEAEALRSALIAAFGAGSEIETAYASRGYAPIWLDASGAANDAARVLVETLGRAHLHALPAEKYAGADLESWLAVGGPALEAALAGAYVAYATDVGSGLLTPRRVDRELHVYPERPDPAALVSRAARAAGAAEMAAHLAALPPADPAYQRLIERYAAFRSEAGRDIWGATVRTGRTLRPGDRDTRIAEARARLTAMGDLDPNVYVTRPSAQVDGTRVAANDVTTDVPVQTFDPGHFDQPMVEALQRFQERHGLNLDGVIGPATLSQLNATPHDRAMQIAVNLERLRWMNRDLGERRIMVNLAGFTMAVIENGRETFGSRVVVGKALRHRTPEFSDTMTHMIVNPSWYVPMSIANEEILPKLEAEPDYLETRGMRMVDGRIIQRPGQGNALGTVKFMFPNDFAIYLHDTPSKRLFGRDVRAYSHGCVRVERPHEFAEFLLQGQEAEPAAYFQRVLATGRERRINLDVPLPVHLVYRTAWIDDQGIEQFRGDVYGRDARVAEALADAGVKILE